MKKILISIILAAISSIASAQMIYGNTFPFWNVTGDLTVGGNTTITGTTTQTGVQTFTAAPIVSALTASLPVFTNASKGLASNAMTGTGNVVMSASPTLTGTVGAASGTFSGTLGVTGVATFTVSPVITTSASPASNAACTAGTISWDASYLYICTATGVVKRAALTGSY